MKGLILSGDNGSRLRPFTYTGAKQLAPLANKPILFCTLESPAEVGVRRTCTDQPASLGGARAVKISEGFLGSDPFVLCLDDNFRLPRSCRLVPATSARCTCPSEPS